MIPIEQTPPAVLYKYYPSARIDIFQNWFLRFARPSAFNDSFDSRYGISGDKSLIQRASNFRRQVGIFCLTEDADNQLMWVHYAEQQKGFAIGFHTDSALLTTQGR